MNKRNALSWSTLAVLALALATTGSSGTAHAQASRAPVTLAQAPCTPRDSTVSCCVKTHPGSPERCGATKLEAEEILFAAKVAMELARTDLPEWKRSCMETYVRCKEEEWRGQCYDCFRYCEGQNGNWPRDKCRRKTGND
ncbi:hypothetical protein [Corallococcus llansteffanensis]|uniref:Uncharacterized protein n=1 Tax=Corallococcus llansteffanensis TaxID=2316731 RepID=A0A3A8Q1Z4_9BACT|nr:hypothetical protein [Corallococcus llansteffanensis]RKH61451.1 hypothetical protein D7V93_11655 [Corallococcus llansteffanensis]